MREYGLIPTIHTCGKLTSQHIKCKSCKCIICKQGMFKPSKNKYLCSNCYKLKQK